MRKYVLRLLSCVAVAVGAAGALPGELGNEAGPDSEGEWGVLARASRLGLRATEHVVQTEDGYILRVHRVRRAGAGTGAPVLLMHGLLQSACMWLDAGAAGLASQLAHAGRDVWLGNARGSHYSRGHAWLRPDADASYWRFSADEIGRHDLPALLDHVLAATGAPKLDYVGFSQGGGVFFIMCSERPDYCGKVNLMTALAPAARIAGMKSSARIAFEFFEKAEKGLSERGIWEVMPQGGLIQSMSEVLCNLPGVGLDVCDIMKSVYDGAHPGSVAGPTFLATAASTPAGTSVHNLARYNQHIRSGRFHKYDYGPEQNLLLYGNETAPAYNLSAVTAPTVLMYGKSDRLVDISNIKWLATRLPHLVGAFPVKDPMWSHLDFAMSQNIPIYVYPTIKKYMDKYS